MLITSKTTSSSVVTNSDELIIPIPLIIPGIKTQHEHEFMAVIGPTTNNPTQARILSPRYSKSGAIAVAGGGVGLGIVAALGAVDDKKLATKFTGSTNYNGSNAYRSDPITIGSAAARSIYCDGGIENERNHRLHKWRQVGVFYESPSPIFYNTSAVIRDYPPSDFLSSCYLCSKKLHGKDIYMYRGEKAFCSTECRYQQIAADERKDKKRPRRRNSVSRSSFDVSSSAGASPHLFSPGIMAI
ncbi:hypothetical protein MKW94_020549 [Papaver nudicaule]|uniref:FLZ-type domain-containing protein n=1 Tax=Papaver nudicaule TaxID=74823 RepID=A0AA41VNZ0_PAPNU|nr:hypothetical protein [Papaver nudicaule]